MWFLVEMTPGTWKGVLATPLGATRLGSATASLITEEKSLLQAVSPLSSYRLGRAQAVLVVESSRLLFFFDAKKAATGIEAGIEVNLLFFVPRQGFSSSITRIRATGVH